MSDTNIMDLVGRQVNAINGWRAFRVDINKKVNGIRDLYWYVREAQRRFRFPNSTVTLHFKSIDNPNKVEGFSIDSFYTISEDLFMQRYNEIINSEIDGSEKYSQERRRLMLNVFTLVQTFLGGAGDTDALLFKCLELPGDAPCWKKCIEYAGYSVGDKNLESLSEFNKFLLDNKIPAIVYANSFTLDNSTTFLNKLMDCPKEIVSINKKPNAIMKLNTNDIMPLELFNYGLENKILENRLNADNKEDTRTSMKNELKEILDSDEDEELEENLAEVVFIYDAIKGHYDIIESINGKLEIKDDLYINTKFEVFKKIDSQYTSLFKAKEQNKLNTEQYQYSYKKQVKYIVMDYETVIDFDEYSCMKTFSLTYFVCDDKMLEILDGIDKIDPNDKEKADIAKIEMESRILANCHTAIGFNCTADLVKYIEDTQDQTIYTFITFNGANFDNFLFLEYLLKHEKDANSSYNVQKSKIFYNNNQLLNFYMNQHSTFDLAKHLTGASLKNLCKDFKVKTMSKKEFDHDEAQRLYNNNNLINKLNDDRTYRDKLIEYNTYDVLSTALIFYRYKKALEAIPITASHGKNLHNCLTIGGVIYDIFEKWFTINVLKGEEENEFGKLTLDLYKDIQKCKIAGRVEVFSDSYQQKRKTKKAKRKQRLLNRILEKLVSDDACSLYPYVLSILDVYYPVGAYKKTKKYKKDKIGFYYCDIDQSNLKEANLPLIYAEKTATANEWGSDKILKNYCISNVMIDLLLKNGCDVTIHNGIYFPKQVKSCEMFGFLLDLMKAKNEQDDFKNNNDPRYNAALRNTYKLLMNAISGKIIEGLHLDKTICGTLQSFAKDSQDPKTLKVNVINVIGDNVFYTKTVTEESQLKYQRPIYLGVLCYDYAKRHMYEHLYSKIGLSQCVYTDTDALKFRYVDFVKWLEEYGSKTIVPHWKEIEDIDPRYKTHKLYETNSKVFGSFENELKENNYFYAPQKKTWLSCLINEDGSVSNIKMGCKGVPPNAIVINKWDYLKLKEKSNKDKAKYYLEHKKDYMYDKETGTGKALEFFESIAKDGEAFVLCTAFRKIVKNSKQHVLIEEDGRFNNLNNKIKVEYTLKRIKV